jgi:hypothetical protein
MPADKPSKPSATNASADSAAAAEEAVTDPAEEEAVPLNRAERRAKGRKSGGVPSSRSTLPGKGQTFQSPRQWANRRGGG